MSLKDFNPRALDFSGLPNIGHVDSSLLPSFAAPTNMLDVDDEFIKHLDHFTDLAEQGDFLLDMDPADGDELLAAVAHHAGFKPSPGLQNLRPRPIGSGLESSPRLKLFADGRPPPALNGLPSAAALQARLAAGQFRLPADHHTQKDSSGSGDQSAHRLTADEAAIANHRHGSSDQADQQAPMGGLFKQSAGMPSFHPSHAISNLGGVRATSAAPHEPTWGTASTGDALSPAHAAASSATAHLAGNNISITPTLPQHRAYTPWAANKQAPNMPPMSAPVPAAPPPAAAPAPTSAMDTRGSSAAAPTAPPAGLDAEQQLAAMKELVASLPDAQLLENLLQAGSSGWALGEALAAALQGKAPPQQQQHESHHLQHQQQQQQAAAVYKRSLSGGLSAIGRLPTMNPPQADLAEPLPLSLLPPPTSAPHLVPPPALSQKLAQAAAQQQQAADHLLANLMGGNSMAMPPTSDGPTLTRPRAPAAKVRRFVTGNGGPLTINQEFLEQQRTSHAMAASAAASMEDMQSMQSTWGDDHMLPAHVVLPSSSRPLSNFLAPCQPDTPTLPNRGAQVFGMQAAATSASGSDASTKEAHATESGPEEDDMDEGEDGGMGAEGAEEEGEEGVTSSRPLVYPTGGWVQRREITRASLRQVYDYPINEAAKLLGVGVTVLKKYCRKFDIPRWPYRKLKSMEKLIESVQDYSSQDPDMTSTVLAELCSFRDMIYEDPSIDLEARIKKLRQANFKLEFKQRQSRGASAAAPALPSAVPTRAAGKRGASLRTAQCT